MFVQVRAAVTVNGCLGSAGGEMKKEVKIWDYILWILLTLWEEYNALCEWGTTRWLIKFLGSNNLPCHRGEAWLQTQATGGWDPQFPWMHGGKLIFVRRKYVNWFCSNCLKKEIFTIIWCRSWAWTQPSRWRRRRLSCWWSLGKTITTGRVSGDFNYWVWLQLLNLWYIF